jgi:hypothetical protein
MNYTSAAIGVIGLISIVTWITRGRKLHWAADGIPNVGLQSSPQSPAESRSEGMAEKEAIVEGNDL